MANAKSDRAKIISHDESEVVLHTKPTAPIGHDDDLTPSASIPKEAAVLPMQDTVIFPGMVVPMSIFQEKSARLLDGVLPDQKIIVAVCQRSRDVENPGPDDLYSLGAAVMVLKLLRMEGGNRTLIVHGLIRVRIEQWLDTEPYLRARISPVPDVVEHGTETDALVLHVREVAGRIFQLAPNIPDEASIVLDNIDQPGAMADFLASNLQLDTVVRQSLLEELNVQTRLRRLSEELQRQVEVVELSHKIHDQVKAGMDKSQREYYLHEQIKAIQKELGQQDERGAEIAELKTKVEAAAMPEKVETEVLRELGRFETIPSASPEYNVIRTYMDVMVELPWSKSTADRLDVKVARRVLNQDHYDLDKVKRRILEYLAVRKLAPDSRGPILCFVGPPGVGKTSLGQSIARALGRKFIRMSLGGMRDEAELR